MAKANANIEELHLHIKRPATSTNPKPTARCRVCKRKGLTKTSYWISLLLIFVTSGEEGGELAGAEGEAMVLA